MDTLRQRELHARGVSLAQTADEQRVNDPSFNRARPTSTDHTTSGSRAMKPMANPATGRNMPGFSALAAMPQIPVALPKILVRSITTPSSAPPVDTSTM